MTIYTANQKKKMKFWDIFWGVTSLSLLLLLIVNFVVYQRVTVVGKSMEPDYNDGQLLLVNQLDKNPKRGQVVAVYEDLNIAKNATYLTRFSARFLLKRVIGLPGEEIELVGNKVIIYNKDFPDGNVLNEDYVSSENKQEEENSDYYFPRTKIPDREYFVMGDNRTISLDSRKKGTFPIYAFLGLETLRFWPLNQAEIFKLPNYQVNSVSQDLARRRDQLKTLYKSNETNFGKQVVF